MAYTAKDTTYYSALLILCIFLSVKFHTELLNLLKEHPVHSILLAQCYIFYTFVWLFPVELKHLFTILQSPFGSKLKSPLFMSYIAHFMKALQAYSVYELTREKWNPTWYIDPLTVLGGLSLILLGQALNVGVYNSLGIQGKSSRNLSLSIMYCSLYFSSSSSSNSSLGLFVSYLLA